LRLDPQRGSVFALYMAKEMAMTMSHEAVQSEPPLLQRLRRATQASGLHVDLATPLATAGFIVTNRLAQTTVRYLSSMEPAVGQRLSEELRSLGSTEEHDLLLQERGFTYFHVVQFLYEWARHHSGRQDRQHFCYGMGAGGGGVEVYPDTEVSGLLQIMLTAIPGGDDARQLGDMMALMGPVIVSQVFPRELIHLRTEPSGPSGIRMTIQYTRPEALRDSLRPYGLDDDLGTLFYNTAMHVQGTARLGWTTFARDSGRTVDMGAPVHQQPEAIQQQVRQQLCCSWEVQWSPDVQLRRLTDGAEILARGRTIFEALYRKDLQHYLQRIQSLEVQLQHLEEGGRFHELVGRSARMHQLYQLIAQVAGSDLTVMVRGESGTGKELVARAIHQSSPRNSHPFVPVNCAAFAESLLESELFGYEKGAFTGADATKPGRFELAHGGTLFLDEVGDMPLTTQVKLLRALESRSFERVGGTRALHVDVRIVAATNRDLEELIAKGSFREDLYFRLNVVPVRLPPLREHTEDIPQLAQFFLHQLAHRSGEEPRGLSRGSLDRLLSYSWPGNTRELRNVIERAAVVYATEPVLREGDIVRALGLQEERLTVVDLNARQHLLLGSLSEDPGSTIDDLLGRIATVTQGTVTRGTGRSRRTLQNDLRRLAQLGYARWLKDGPVRRYSATPEGERRLDEMN
jgi:transcriptional regulator with GAF, ATPase, and Fis domain